MTPPGWTARTRARLFAAGGTRRAALAVTALEDRVTPATPVPVDDPGGTNSVSSGSYLIGDYVWDDSNGNGRQDPTESGINGISVTLYKVGAGGQLALIQSATTGAKPTTGELGWYGFGGTAGDGSGSYVVKAAIPTGYRVTRQNYGADVQDSDFRDEAGTAVSDPFGLTPQYINPYDYYVNYDIDAGFTKALPAAVGDFVWQDLNNDGQQTSGEPGVGGVVVRLSGQDGFNNWGELATTLTDAAGRYGFANLWPGQYKVKVDLPSQYTAAQQDKGSDTSDSDIDQATFQTAPFALAPGQYDDTRDAGLVAAAVGDFVWDDRNANGVQDASEPGVAGVAVHLTGPGGPRVVTTDGAGGYLFAGLAAGQYALQFDLPAGRAAAPLHVVTNNAVDSDVSLTGSAGPFALAAGQVNRDVDAGLVAPRVFAPVPAAQCGPFQQATTSVLRASGGWQPGFSRYPVRYADGMATLTFNDLAADGFVGEWGRPGRGRATRPTRPGRTGATGGPTPPAPGCSRTAVS